MPIDFSDYFCRLLVTQELRLAVKDFADDVAWLQANLRTWTVRRHLRTQEYSVNFCERFQTMPKDVLK